MPGRSSVGRRLFDEEGAAASVNCDTLGGGEGGGRVPLALKHGVSTSN